MLADTVEVWTTREIEKLRFRLGLHENAPSPPDMRRMRLIGDLKRKLAQTERHRDGFRT